MRTAILAAALLAATVGPTAAQERAPRKVVQKVIQLKNGDSKAIVRLLAVFDCSISIDDSLKAIALKCPEDVMPAVEDVIKRFDVPPTGPTNIEVTAYFLVASDSPPVTSTPVSPPTELDSVIKQIRSVFAAKNFYMLDTLQLRMSSGEPGEVSGRLNDHTIEAPKLTRLYVGRWSARPGDKGDVISLERVRAGLRNPVKKGEESTYVDTGVDLTKVEVPLGQKVVLGKSSLMGAGTALIVVLTARVP